MPKRPRRRISFKSRLRTAEATLINNDPTQTPEEIEGGSHFLAQRFKDYVRQRKAGLPAHQAVVAMSMEHGAKEAQHAARSFKRIGLREAAVLSILRMGFSEELGKGVSYATLLPIYFDVRGKMGNPSTGHEQLVKFAREVARRMGIANAGVMLGNLIMKVKLSPISHIANTPHYSFTTIFERLSKEKQLNNDKVQKEILTLAFNQALGSPLGTQGRAPLLQAIRALGKPADSALIGQIKKVIPDFDTRQPDIRRRIVQRFRMRELSKLIPACFEHELRLAGRGNERVDASRAWMRELLENADNRIFLANLAVEWMGPKRKGD